MMFFFFSSPCERWSEFCRGLNSLLAMYQLNSGDCLFLVFDSPEVWCDFEVGFVPKKKYSVAFL